jgi:hypothetical protein
LHIIVHFPQPHKKTKLFSGRISAIHIFAPKECKTYLSHRPIYYVSHYLPSPASVSQWVAESAAVNASLPLGKSSYNAAAAAVRHAEARCDRMRRALQLCERQTKVLLARATE